MTEMHHNSAYDALADLRGMDTRVKRNKGNSGRSKTNQNRAILGRMDARKCAVIGEETNALAENSQKEGPSAYSETAQEIKMRRAAEKRARKAGKHGT